MGQICRISISESPDLPDRPWVPPKLLYNEYRVFCPGNKAVGT